MRTRALSPIINDLILVFTYGQGESADGQGNGLRDLGEKIAFEFSSVKVFYQSYKDDVSSIIMNASPAGKKIMLVGHSWGGSKSVETCNSLSSQGVKIDELILLDPVPQKGWGFVNFKDFIIPNNVSKADCWLRKSLSRIAPPWSCPIRKATCPYTNTEKWWSHNDFCSKEETQDLIYNEVKRLIGK